MHNPHENTEHAQPYRQSARMKRLQRAAQFAVRFKRDSSALDAFLADIQEDQDVPEKTIAALRTIFLAIRGVWLDDVGLYAVDRYLLTGIGALDLVLLAVIIPLNAPDRPLFVATLLLAISLILVSSALFVGFVKRRYALTYYKRVHGTLISLAQLSGAGALAATFWHVSPFIGWVFVILAFVASVACLGYALLVQTGVRYFEIVEKEPDSEATPESVESAEHS